MKNRISYLHAHLLVLALLSLLSFLLALFVCVHLYVPIDDFPLITYSNKLICHNDNSDSLY